MASAKLSIRRAGIRFQATEGDPKANTMDRLDICSRLLCYFLANINLHSLYMEADKSLQTADNIYALL